VFDPAILKWVPLGALVLIFFLQMFAWVGVYPGGNAAYTQGAWGAAFGTGAEVKPYSSQVKIESEADQSDRKGPPPNSPMFSPLLFFYLIPFFYLTLALAVAIAVLPHLKVALPPAVEQLMPWRWAILAGLNAVLLLFLLLQMLLGFSLETRWSYRVNENPAYKAPASASLEKQAEADVKRGNELGYVQRTWALSVVLFLHFIATLAAWLVYWIDKRGPSKPLPVVETRW
jgi:hypothetical protein